MENLNLFEQELIPSAVFEQEQNPSYLEFLERNLRDLTDFDATDFDATGNVVILVEYRQVFFQRVQNNKISLQSTRDFTLNPKSKVMLFMNY